MAAEMAERIGARMKARREELRLTQAEVARRMPGTTTSDQVSRWERGKHQPNNLDSIAEALEVDVSYFYVAAPAKAETPDPFKSNGGSTDERLERIEAVLNTMLERFEGLAHLAQEQRSELMDRLEALETAILHNGDVVADRAVDKVRDIVKQPDEVARAIEALAAELHADADQAQAQRASERGRRAAPRRPVRAAK